MDKRKLLHLSILWVIYGSLINRFIWSNQLIAVIPDILLCILLFMEKPRKEKKQSAIICRQGCDIRLLQHIDIGSNFFTHKFYPHDCHNMGCQAILSLWFNGLYDSTLF